MEKIKTQLVVLGSGPGGYTAAFRAADLGKQVVLVEKYAQIGGVCLNVGCIPSKALLHTAEVINEAKHIQAAGVSFGDPKIDLDKLRDFKNSVTGKLNVGLKGLAKQRKVQIVQGIGKFKDENHLEVSLDGKTSEIEFENCIIASGSRVIQIPNFPYDDERMIDSTGALELKDIPKKMLIIGGGIIGLEMACVYNALGSKIKIVELQKQIIPGLDIEIANTLKKQMMAAGIEFVLGISVSEIKAEKSGLKVSFSGDKAPDSESFDKVLVAVGRKANSDNIGIENTGIKVSERGFIEVDKQMKTNVNHIFAIGDIVGQPMLAHKAVHEGKVAAEVVCGHKTEFVASVIPSVAYTDPEVSWVGVTETEAKAKNIEYTKGVFPWAASGRALGVNRTEGMTKILFDKQTNRVIGGVIIGVHAGDLIAEVALAIEMGCDSEDLSLTIHPHPTLSETVCFAAEMENGSITDLLPPKKR